MLLLEFIKMQGAGNDFIVFDAMSSSVDLGPEQVRALCDRHFGIGADGVIIVSPSSDPGCAAFMDYRNADGSLAQMCGNGVRCFAKYLVDSAYVDSGAPGMLAQTRAGVRPLTFTLDGAGRVEAVTVDMGEPALAPAEIPVILPGVGTVNAGSPAAAPAAQDDARQGRGASAAIAALLDTPCGVVTMTCVNMGNPHAVIFLEDLDEVCADEFARDASSYDIKRLGQYLESLTEVFPEKTNVEFAAVMRDSLGIGADARETAGRPAASIRMRVWERGVGETLACGTGACATAVAACLTGRAGRRSRLCLPGGELDIEWRDDNHVYMTGAATEVFRGAVAVDAGGAVGAAGVDGATGAAAAAAVAASTAGATGAAVAAVANGATAATGATGAAGAPAKR